MKRLWLTLVAASLLAIAAVAPALAQDTITIDLEETEDSGVSGTATLTAENGTTNVVIELTGMEEDAVHPIHIHDGTCEDLGGVAYPLEDIVDGMSETTVDVSLDDLMTGEFAINAHLSADEMAVWINCGDIPAAPEEEDDEEADDEEVVDDEADDEEVDDEDAEDVVPAAGSTGGVGTDTAVMMIVLLAAVALGTGFVVRRRAYQT
jgi:hypothetical protein